MGFSQWFPWSKRIRANRKYVDLIYDATSLWAEYMPFKATPLKVGDFGFIVKDTGEFEYRGNIYKDETIVSAVPELKEERYHPQPSEPVSKWIITAKTTHSTEASAKLSSGFAGVVEASIDVEVSFQAEERGAFLVMYRPQTMELPKDVLLEKLSRVLALQEKGLSLVTKVITCPAYALQMSDKGASAVRVKFIGELPIPTAPGLTAGGQVSFGWKSEHVGSSYQEACNDKGEHTYCPLFALRQIRPKRHLGFRQAGEVRRGDDTWMDIVPPWDSLDEDGNELPVGMDEDETEDAAQTQSNNSGYLSRVGIVPPLLIGLCAIGAVAVSKIYNGV